MNKQDIITLGASFGVPRGDVFLMLQKTLNISSKDLFLLSDIDEKYIPDIKQSFIDRQSGVPLEHILGETDFYGYKFLVTSDALIPRNDTEVLVEKVVKYIKKQNQKISLVDIGTGTGCIPVSIICEIGDSISDAHAIDISTAALQVANKNAALHNIAKDISFIEGDLFSPLKDKDFQNLVVTANLPYIINNDFDNIDSPVRDHEPHTALFGGESTGFELYEKLIDQLQSVQAESMVLFIEIGFDQGNVVREFCKTNNIIFQIYTDNGEVERCVEMKIC